MTSKSSKNPNRGESGRELSSVRESLYSTRDDAANSDIFCSAEGAQKSSENSQPVININYSESETGKTGFNSQNRYSVPCTNEANQGGSKNVEQDVIPSSVNRAEIYFEFIQNSYCPGEIERTLQEMWDDKILSFDDKIKFARKLITFKYQWEIDRNGLENNVAEFLTEQLFWKVSKTRGKEAALELIVSMLEDANIGAKFEILDNIGVDEYKPAISVIEKLYAQVDPCFDLHSKYWACLQELYEIHCPEKLETLKPLDWNGYFRKHGLEEYCTD